jgi:3-oxoacyl-[acyl-carrier protein] reductase
VELSVRAAVVTGGARGIGAAIARELARHGVGVLIADIDGEAAARGAAELAADGAEAIAVACDVTDEASVAAAIERAIKHFGRLDGLVNNAGILWRAGPQKVATMSREEWRAVLDVNLDGTFLCSRAALPHMASAGFGRIVNLASLAIRTGGAGGFPHYVAAKTAIAGLTKALAREAAPHGITVNAVAPGIIDTEMLALQPAEVRAELLRTIPLGRIGTPEDVAGVVLCLMSHRFGYVTGVVIDINGGMLMP